MSMPGKPAATPVAAGAQVRLRLHVDVIIGTGETFSRLAEDVTRQPITHLRIEDGPLPLALTGRLVHATGVEEAPKPGSNR